jgi:hypothetical protein
MAEVEKFVLRIGGQDIWVTDDEAKALWQQLDEIYTPRYLMRPKSQIILSLQEGTIEVASGGSGGSLGNSGYGGCGNLGVPVKGQKREPD